MNYVLIWIVTIFVMILFFTSPVCAMRINELYPAPTSGESEWVEIYNDEDKTIDLSAYALVDEKNNAIAFETTIASPSSYIIATATNVLNNAGDSVYLKKTSGETIDSVTYSDSFATDKSYARCPDGTGLWTVVAMPTKRTTNEPACVSPTPPITPALTPTPTAADTPSVQEIPLYTRVYISEVMAGPHSNSNEWIELYNDNDFTVSLQNWFIDDTENSGATPRSFSLEIQPHSYAVYELSSSIFNNTGDSVRLLDSSNILKDLFAFSSSVTGKTWGKIDPVENAVCMMEPTRGYENSGCLAVNSSPVPSATSTQTPTPIILKYFSTPTPTFKVITPTRMKTSPAPTAHLPRSLYEPASFSGQLKVTKPAKVLGAKTVIDEPESNTWPLQKIIAACGFFISFLTIILIFIKIKKRTE